MYVDDKQLEAFALQQGFTLQNWTKLEASLFWVYNNAMLSQSRGDVNAKEFEALLHFTTKLKATDQILQTLLKPKAKAHWSMLKSKIKNLADKRNKLVHWETFELRLEDGSFEVVQIPPIATTLLNGERDYEQAIKLGDLVSWSGEFNILAKELSEFSRSTILNSDHVNNIMGRPV